MKCLKLSLIALSFLSFASCSKDDDNTTKKEAVVTKKITNLKATQVSDYSKRPPVISGDFQKFSFAEGKVVSHDKWDVAFRGTTILVNGGTKGKLTSEPNRTGKAAAYIAAGTMADISTVDESKLKQDAADALAIKTGSGNGWYTYDMASHQIKPTPGKIIVIKTHDGKYAKIEMINYYKDGDGKTSQYLTFNYLYQPNSGDKSLK